MGRGILTILIVVYIMATGCEGDGGKRVNSIGEDVLKLLESIPY